MINFYSVDDICNANKDNVENKRALSVGFLLEDNYIQIELEDLYGDTDSNVKLYAFTKDYVMNTDIILKDGKYNRVKGIATRINPDSEEVSVIGQSPIPIRTNYNYEEIDADKDMVFVLLTDGEFIGIPSYLILNTWQIYQKSEKKKKAEIKNKIIKLGAAGLSVYAIINIFTKTRKSL